MPEDVELMKNAIDKLRDYSFYYIILSAWLLHY